jgi:SAM-dependent methyltransferase
MTPPPLVGNKSPTLNGMGYIFYTITPMGEIFLEQEALPGRHLFEMGSGYGNIPLKALPKGVASYTAFDLYQEHLDILKQRLQQNLGIDALERITFMAGHAPQDLPRASHQFDAILIDKVIHFLSPEEIVQTLTWAKNALKPGGSIYVSVSTPYANHLSQKVREDYEKRQAAGEPFPGVVSHIMDLLDATHMANHPDLILPPAMVLFTEPNLVRLFEREGFVVTYSASLKNPDDKNPLWEHAPLKESPFAEVIARWG